MECVRFHVFEVSDGPMLIASLQSDVCTEPIASAAAHPFNLFLVRLGLIRGPFEKFVDSPHHSESESRGGAVTAPPSNANADVNIYNGIKSRRKECPARTLKPGNERNSGSSGY
jgi:hypothetical protein